VLQSQFFSGDPRLEACAVQDSAHIFQGDVGEHVSKVQAALFLIDDSVIDRGELSAKKYGPSTAAAVLAFKQERNIINRSYQTQADDIVGKMTIAELDKELAELENPPSDGVGCMITDNGDHLYIAQDDIPKPSFQLAFLISAATTASVGAATSGTLSDAQIMQNAFNASRASLREAVRKLDNLIAAIRKSRGQPLDAVNIMTFIAAVKWLNLDPRNPALTIPTIQSARDLMDRNANLKTSTGGDPPLARGGPITVLDASGSPVTTTDYHANTPGGADRGTDCGDSFFNDDGPHCRRDVITHEFFHMLGVHHGGGPSNAATNRSAITTSAQALDSADNLAQLAAQLTTRNGVTDACTRSHE
jgi:hypothetical protein